MKKRGTQKSRIYGTPENSKNIGIPKRATPKFDTTVDKYRKTVIIGSTPLCREKSASRVVNGVPIAATSR